MERLRVDLITYTPTYFEHCPHCELAFEQAGIRRPVQIQAINEYPEALKAEYAALSDWVRHVHRRYGGWVLVRILDPLSLRGFWTVLRHRIRRFPALQVEGRVLEGWDRHRWERTIEDTLAKREISWRKEEKSPQNP